ncbi:amidohydrolase family protein [Tropicimonas sp. TH_r6]|uniref:amidohydrolase family protein n=1 Tax=Tropicimonas sp. TH_r6 TaxID=3082085 RepID=UPI002954B34C|nr:amidohydrolase family protein [Tropicimonas sp. TH_r6]MDV7141463.1 amidohydrolase family protein [Tropicimonas sp. TH_r6]
MIRRILVLGCALSGVILASCAGADGDQPPIGDAVNELPIFDAHIHYKEPAWAPYPVESIIELMDRNGVAMGLVSSTPDEGTIKLWEFAPNRVVPELRPYHGSAGSSNWAKVDGMEEYLEARLERYPHEGIGEFHIHRLDITDVKFFRAVVAMARERDIYLHVHSGTESIRWLKSLDGEVKIIWAHAGLSTPAPEVHALMAEFPDLLADTSLREWDIDGGGRGLDPTWERIIFDFQDRLMVGSDTWVNSQWDNYDAIIASNRSWLSKLPRDVAEKIAYRNAERVFGRQISMDQIGTR